MILPVALYASVSLSPAQLKTDHLVAPLGIDDPTPVISWIDVGGEQAQMQDAYQVLVASSPKKLNDTDADLWNSGKVRSDDMAVQYAGKALASGKRAWWKVRVWSKTDDDYSESKPTFWESGILNRDDWKAQWIALPDSLQTEGARPSPFLRKDITIPAGVTSARAYVSAKGLYEFYVDGKKVGTAWLAPGWTDYRKRVQYQTFDLSATLKPGPHVLGLVLGDGWYCGHVGLTGGNNYGKKPWGLVQLSLSGKDDNVTTIGSDSSWKGATGPIVSDDLLMGETYDARKEIASWAGPGAAAGAWGPVETAPLGDELLVGQHSPTIEVLDELKPIKITQPSANTYVFDLGQNMVGHARLRVHGPAGTTVKLRFAEMLNPDGTVYTTNLRGAKATDYYTLKGTGEEVCEPRFTFHGFRYVEVTGYPGVPATNAVTGVVLGSANPKTGTFECSSKDINQLQHNIFWGQRGNYVSIPTDCPQRDERLGWMGDAQIFARTACFNNDVEPFLTKWTQDVVDAQSAEGGFADVSPRMGDQSDGAPAWGDAGVLVPWTVYQCYGDLALLRARYPAMKAWIGYIDSVNPDHLWINRSNNNFGDWLNVQDDTPRDVLATAYFAHSTDVVRRAAEALGETADAEHYRQLFDQIRAAYQQSFVDPDGKIKGDSQTDYVMALNFDLLPDSLRANAANRLVDHIVKDRKTHLSTGFVGSGMLNPTLTKAGQTELAYKLLQTDTYPSWLYSIRQGATTIWERWDGWTKDKGFQDPGMNSFNHYSFGAVGQWMYSTVGGIDFDQPGYKHIVIHPIPGPGINWAKTSLDSIRGKIACDWKKTGRHFDMSVTIPGNTTADVLIPAAGADEVMVNGSEALLTDGITTGENRDGCVVFRVGSGHYRFETGTK